MKECGTKQQPLASWPHQTHLQAARLASHHPYSCTKDFNPQLRPIPIYQPQTDKIWLTESTLGFEPGPV
jgi:hypothetical protein